jgi:hypothetical protein
MMDSAEFIESGSGRRRWILIGGIVLVFLVVFRYEIIFIARLGKALPMLLLGLPVEGFPPIDDILRLLGFVGLNLLGVFTFALFLLFIISPHVLPVRSGIEAWRALQRLYNFLLGSRAAVVFVKEGRMEDEISDGTRANAVVVDLNSAIVLEGRVGASHSQPSDSSRRPMARVGHPGLVLIGRSERLRGAVSLRRQFRSNNEVLATTSDGIEVKTSVFTTFSISRPASVIKVAYVGGDEPDDLRVLQVDETTARIKAITDELDEQDKIEIHGYAQNYQALYEMNAPLQPTENYREYPPFAIDDERIFNAVYSQGRGAGSSQRDQWTDMPAMVATELFRSMISQVTYDSLFLPEVPDKFPLQEEFIPRFNRLMRNLGVLSYQFCLRYDSESPLIGQSIDRQKFRVSPVQKLRNSRLLRDRGIKIISAGISELRPTEPLIPLQRIEYWRARWQQETEMIMADHDLEIMRIRNQARAEKQAEIIGRLSQILNSPSYSEEGQTLRVFQALEDVASDPATRQFLPLDSIKLLQKLRLWLLPDDGVRPSLLEEPSSAQDGE